MSKEIMKPSSDTLNEYLKTFDETRIFLMENKCRGGQYLYRNSWSEENSLPQGLQFVYNLTKKEINVVTLCELKIVKQLTKEELIDLINKHRSSEDSD